MGRGLLWGAGGVGSGACAPESAWWCPPFCACACAQEAVGIAPSPLCQSHTPSQARASCAPHLMADEQGGTRAGSTKTPSSSMQPRCHSLAVWRQVSVCAEGPPTSTALAASSLMTALKVSCQRCASSAELNASVVVLSVSLIRCLPLCS